MITILPDRNVYGWTGDLDDIPGYPTVPVADGLRAVYGTDAHFVAYHIEEDGAALPQCPRLNKTSKALDILASEGADVLCSVIAIDVDDPTAHATKEPSSERWRAGFLLSLEQLPDAYQDGLGWYLTKGGARLLWALDPPLPVARYEKVHAGLVAYLIGMGIEADTGTADWTRLFRLPRVVRGGVAQELLMDLDCLGDAPLPVAPEPAPQSIGALVASAPLEFKAFELPKRIIEGAVDDTLFRYAAQLRQKGWEYIQILDQLEHIHQTQCWRLDGTRFDTADAMGDLERLTRNACKFEPGGSAAKDPQTPKPTIKVTPDVHRVVAAAEDALITTDAGTYQRDGRLIRVTRTPRGLAKIGGYTLASMRSRLTWAAAWMRPGDNGQWVPTEPPNSAVQGLLEEAAWRRFLLLERVVTAPMLRPDGTVLSEPGYDSATCTWFDSGGLTFPVVPDAPTKEQARAALDQLLDLLADFPFREPAARSVALAAMLTGVTRDAYGACPLILIDAHTPGTGKSLLAEVVVRLSQGAPMATQKWTGDTEMDKRVTSALLAGGRFMVLDNIPPDRPLGGATLDALLTSGRWSGRRLGVSEQVDLPNTLVVMATGNNVTIRGDLSRRCLRCALTTDMERPETRTGFRYANLKEHVIKARPELVSAALTVVRAYLAAGAPSVARPLGSFEGWDRVVRSPLVWLGEVDPVDSQDALRADSDTAMEGWMVVLSSWRRAYGDKPKTAADLANLPPRDGLRVALTDLVSGDYDARSIGYVLRAHQDRIVSGMRLKKIDRKKSGRSYVVDLFSQKKTSEKENR